VRKIQESIDEVRQQRSLRREARNAVPLGTVALVGYTNAGKSTLFNALSQAEVLVSSRMFATLDPTVRALRLPSNRRILISDTVGFIRALPKGLMTAFRATLEEVQEAALILQVSDLSNPYHDELEEEVEKILGELGVLRRPRLRVFNKVDRLSGEQREQFAAAWSRAQEDEEPPVFISALTGEGLEELLRRIDGALPVDPVVKMALRMPLSEGRALALIHALGRVLHSSVDESHMELEAEVPEAVARRLKLRQFEVKETLRPSASYR
jgi:GTP-binding protein HflX